MLGGGVPAATEMGIKVASMFLDGLSEDLRQEGALWDDAYVVGFMTSCAIKGAPSFGPELSDPKAVVPVAAAVLARLSGGDEPAMEDRIRRLARSRDADFYRGAAAADKVLSVAWKNPGFDRDPEIEAARERARSMRQDSYPGGIGEEKVIVAILQEMFFTDVVRDRLEHKASRRSDGD